MSSARSPARPSSRFILPIALAFSGCSTTVDFPMNHFQTSEALGAAKIRLDGAYQAQNSIVLSEDFTLTPPTTSNPRIETDPDFFLGGAYGVLENLDVGLRTPLHGFAKFQIVGPSRASSALASKEEFVPAFSLAIAGSVGRSNTTEEESAWFSTSVYRVELDATYVDLMLSAGYRSSKTLLLYGGPYFTRTLFEGEYRDTTGGVATALKGSGKTWGGVLGGDIRVIDQIGIQVELGMGHTKSGATSDSTWGIGAMGSLYF